MNLTPEQLDDFTPLLEQAETDGWAEWIKSDADRLAMLDGCYFDVIAAERFRAFCARALRIEHPQTGKLVPFELTDWQYRDIMGPLFGWKAPDGYRRFRSAFISMASGNAKSSLVAAALLYLTFAEGEPCALSYACSTSSGAARTIFDFCVRMIRNSPALAKRLRIVQGSGRILSVKDPLVQLRVAPATVDAIEGKDVHAAVYDEIHIAKNRLLYDALSQRFRARKQGLMIVITTASSDRQSIAYELYEDAKKLLAGAVVDHARFAYIAEASHNDDIRDAAVWRRANPGLGFCVSERDIATQAKLAADSPAKVANFRVRRLNTWGLNDVQSFIDIDRWLACRADVNPDALVGREAYGGLDMSGNDDLTAFSLIFPADDGSIDVLTWHWLPQDVIHERAKTDCDLYPTWVQQGWLETTNGNWIDQPYVIQRISEICSRYNVRELAFDPQFAAANLAPELEKLGFTAFTFWQHHRMYTPVLAKFDSLVLSGRIRHNNPMLDWQMSHLTVHINKEGHMKPEKPRGRKGRNAGRKIDGVSAILMALGNVVKMDQNESNKPFYTESPLILIG